MENTNEDKQKKQDEEEGQKQSGSNAAGFRATQKGPKESKRVAIREKKSFKKERNGHKKGQVASIDYHTPSNHPEEESSAINRVPPAKKQKITCSLSQLTTPYSLDKLIHKPPYITITKGNRIIGDFGHSTALFKRPVIEGQVYMEFLVREDTKKEKKPINTSAVRIGLCPHSFNPSFPLGYGESISYKSADGSIVTRGQKVESGPSYGNGDVIGICMKISPAEKVPNPEAIHQGSSVVFFKNGEKVKEWRGLKQIFYCFGVSLYNYSQVEVVGGTPSVYKMPPDSKHYFSVLTEKIPYKDLETKRVFKL